MAPTIPTVPNTPIQDRFNDFDDSNNNTRPLPTGECCFKDLSFGTKCGCRRFWTQSQGVGGSTTYGNAASAGQLEVCMCKHHACFHENTPSRSTGSQRQSRAFSNVSTLNHDAIQRMGQVNHQPTTQQNVNPSGNHESIFGSRNDARLPSNPSWNRYFESHYGVEDIPAKIPAIPEGCVLHSRNTSRSSSMTRYTRPFGGLGLDTLSHVQRPSPQAQDTGKETQAGAGRPMQPYQEINGETHFQSLTDVATVATSIELNVGPLDGGVPAKSGTERPMQAYQDINGQTHFQSLTDVATIATPIDLNVELLDRVVPENPVQPRVSQDSRSKPESKVRNTSLMDFDNTDDPLVPDLRKLVADYPITKSNHEDRLDALETVSSLHARYDALREAHDNLDGRVCELDERHETIDTRLEELQDRMDNLERDDGVAARRDPNASMDSKVSNSSSATDDEHSDLAARFEDLEFQLQTFLPSYRNPLKIEVVFIPFGSLLGGLWATKAELQSNRSRANSSASEEYTQTQHNAMAAAQAALSREDFSLSWEAATSYAGQDGTPWLLPKACSENAKPWKRLRARGLVQTVEIRGPNARDVQVALMEAFRDLPNVLAMDPSASYEHSRLQVPDALKNYLGLRASWIPLRKLHKDSVLHFLDASEMVTPALWTLAFLSSSVIMRSRKYLPRLYVTQPDSYIQHLGSSAPANWTWEKLEHLSKPEALGNGDSNQMHETDSEKSIWEYDSRYDPSQCVSSSFTSENSQSLSIRTVEENNGLEDHEPTFPSDDSSSAGVTTEMSTTPTSNAPIMAAIGPRKECRPFRPLRTSSMSALAPLGVSQIGKRRIASFDRELQSSPIRKLSNRKRRRVSRSPSHPRELPRFGIGPPSPMTNTHETTQQKGGKSQFAYATPYSNAPYLGGSDAEHYGGNSQWGDVGGGDLAWNNIGDGSTTDEMAVDYGHEQNALSDYDQSSEIGEQHEDEWEGVEEDNAEIPDIFHGPSSKVEKDLNKSQEKDKDQHEGKGGYSDDSGNESDASSSPSEYPIARSAASAREMSGSPPSEYRFMRPANWRSKTGFPIFVDKDVDRDDDYDELGR